MRKEVADIRVDYTQGELHESQIADNPIVQFERWFQAAVAAEVPEPNAMILATVADGQPSARVVLLKGFDERGFCFYTNYESRKGQELAANPKAALTFFWPELERQIRLEGTIEKVSPEESDTYYQSRGRASRLGAWASPQSQVIEDRSLLEERVQEVSQRFEGQETFPRPGFWGGFRLRAHYLEFWQGRKSRLHDRIVYESVDDAWQIKRIAP
ncbi:MAG: pyridoxamine 5'-phosphate oxidase [Bacteroidota bacterium]